MRKLQRILSAAIVAAMLVGLMPAMTLSSSAAFNDTTLKFDANGEFVIMQLTDIQDDAEVDETTLALITKAVDRYEPDLVVLTGDNVAGKMGESDFKASADQFLAPIINKGVRYAVTFGNHDSESNTLNTAYSRQNQYDYYVSKSYLGIDYDEESLNGVGTGAIPVYTNDEKYVAFCVFPMDSGDYDSNGDYDHVEADQIAWYESEATRLAALSRDGNRVPTMVFQHIPVPEIYDTLLVQATSTTANAVRGTGNWSNNYYVLDPSNSTIVGKMNEGPCPSAINAGQYQSWLNVGNMVGAFYGHDHTNTFWGTDSNGITQGYSKAATLHSYNDGDPGIRIFTVKEDGSYTTTQHTYSSMQVEDSKEYEHDTVAGTPTVPEKLYVGDEDNSIAQQKLGSTIQLQSLNYKTQAMYANDLTVTIDLANTVTDVSLTPHSGINISSVVKTAKDSSTDTYTWQITGGSATAGTAAEFKISYVSDGVTYHQYAYSYVEEIKTPAGHYVFTRNYRVRNVTDNYNSQTYVMTVLGDMVFGDTRATTDTDLISSYSGEALNPWTNAAPGYYNYLGSSDSGFVATNDLRYGLNYCSTERARAHYYFPRFTEAGKSPVATIYVDSSRYSTIGDLGISVNYWRHLVTEHDLETTFKLYFKLGDVGYTPDNVTTGTAGTTTISGHTSSINLAAARGSNNSFNLTGSIPSDGTQYTLISHGYSYWDKNDSTPHNGYMPVLLSFVTYNKAALRSLVNSERAAMRQTDNITYRAAFKEAYKVVQKDNTTQAEIDSAITMLNAAIETLSFTGDNISSNSAQAGTTTIPPYVYIAGSGYGLSQQPTGNNIQTAIIDFTDSTLDYSVSTFYFQVPQGASNATVTVTTAQTGSSVEYTWEADTGEGHLTGGTASLGDYITYNFTYTIGSKTYKQTEVSIVMEAPQPSGWHSWVIRQNGSLVTKASTYVASNLMGTAGAMPEGFYFNGITGTTGSRGSEVALSGEYYGVNLTAMDSLNNQGVTGYAMMNWQRGKAWFDYNNIGEMMCGTDGKTDCIDDTSVDNNNYRAKFVLYIDPSAITNMSQTNLIYKSYGMNNTSNTERVAYATMQEASGFYTGTRLIADLNSMTGRMTSLYLGPVVTDDGRTTNTFSHTGGDWVYQNVMGTVPAAGNYTFYAAYYTKHTDKGLSVHLGWNFEVIINNKSSLRDLLAQEAEYNRQLFDGYDDSNGKFTAYYNALTKAKAAAKNVTMNEAEASDIMLQLNTAIAELEYLKADYTAVTAKVLEVRTDHADGTYSYRPSPNNDPTYYATGIKYPWNYFSSTNEVDIPIDNINWNLDIRYQSTVDGYVDAIDIGWLNVMLAAADYTVVDRYLGYKTGTGENGAAGGSGIMLPEKYSYLLNKEYVDASNYTSDSYQKWTDACAAGQANRALKSPDQAQVDVYAANLQAAYDALTLKDADYTALDEIIGEIERNISQTALVVDPSNSANNYTIPYYTPEYTALLSAKAAERTDGLVILEQDEIDSLTLELEELYAKLGENLNSADYYFAEIQKTTEAEYEAEYEKYYTAASWEALVTARAAIKSGRLTSEQEQVNTWAKAIYDARNALVYNGADYSVVAEYRAKYDELVAHQDWYTNWTNFAIAYAAVVDGLDVTEQTKVDTYAVNLKTAYDALELKLADYSELTTQISIAEAKTENQIFYTEGSYQNFYNEYLEAKEFAAMDKLTVDQQAVVDGYASDLAAAIEALKWKSADMEPLDNALNAFYNLNVYNESYLEEGKPDADGDGIADLWVPVQAALDAAEALKAKESSLDIRNNSEIVAAANALNVEVAKLPALYIEVTLEEARIPQDLSIYTVASVNNLYSVLISINRNLTIANQATVDEYAIALSNAIDALELADLSLVAKSGTTTVIDNERGFIYGLVDADLAAITDIVADGWAEVVGDGHVVCTPVEGYSNLGTGAKVELIRDSDSSVAKTYYIVIFGDNDGDGYVTLEDATDIRKYNAILDCKYEYEDFTIPQVFAMDINADGVVDLTDDYYIIAYASVLSDSIKQTYQGQA